MRVRHVCSCLLIEGQESVGGKVQYYYLDGRPGKPTYGKRIVRCPWCQAVVVPSTVRFLPRAVAAKGKGC